MVARFCAECARRSSCGGLPPLVSVVNDDEREFMSTQTMILLVAIVCLLVMPEAWTRGNTRMKSLTSLTSGPVQFRMGRNGHLVHRTTNERTS